jgi:hypothetical protein
MFVPSQQTQPSVHGQARFSIDTPPHEATTTDDTASATSHLRTA